MENYLFEKNSTVSYQQLSFDDVDPDFSVQIDVRPRLGVKLNHDRAYMPTKAHPTDACWDLYLAEQDISYSHNYTTVTCHTGIHLDIPNGYFVQLYPRSSISKTTFSLANSVGVVDPSYTGEIILKFRSEGLLTSPFNIGDRIGQMKLDLIHDANLVEVDNIIETQRGSGGFGSTGS